MSHEILNEPGQRFQPDRTEVGVVAILGAALLGILVVALLMMAWFFAALERAEVQGDSGRSVLAGERLPPPRPHLQVSPPAEMRAFEAEQKKTLHSYGWVDREAGIVRIPIERAMALTAESLMSQDRGEAR